MTQTLEQTPESPAHKKSRWKPAIFNRRMVREFANADGQIGFKTKSWTRTDCEHHLTIDTATGEFHCSCADHQFRRHACKHIIAACELLQKSGELKPLNETLSGESAPEESFDDKAPPAPIAVVVVLPGAAPQVRRIPNTLEAKQRIVGGRIECFEVGIPGAIGICNEEFIFEGLPFNRTIPATGLQVCGAFLIVGDGANGEFCGLSPRQVEAACRMFAVGAYEWEMEDAA
jgi:hypothetical protein